MYNRRLCRKVGIGSCDTLHTFESILDGQWTKLARHVANVESDGGELIGRVGNQRRDGKNT